MANKELTVKGIIRKIWEDYTISLNRSSLISSKEVFDELFDLSKKVRVIDISDLECTSSQLKIVTKTEADIYGSYFTVKREEDYFIFSYANNNYKLPIDRFEPNTL